MAHHGSTRSKSTEALRRIDAEIAGDFDELLAGQLDSIEEVLGTIDEELADGRLDRAVVKEPPGADLTPPPELAERGISSQPGERTPMTAPVEIGSSPKPRANLLMAILALINAPLRALPEPWRTFTNLMVLTLLAWVPVVWAVVWLLS